MKINIITYLQKKMFLKEVNKKTENITDIKARQIKR